MGSLPPISVWFTCKLCAGLPFKQLETFLHHKRESHFTEFQNIKYIVFEEKIIDQDLIDANVAVDSFQKSKSKPPRFRQSNIADDDTDNDLSHSSITDSMIIKQEPGIEETDFNFEISEALPTDITQQSNTTASVHYDSDFEFDPLTNVKCEFEEFDVECDEDEGNLAKFSFQDQNRSLDHCGNQRETSTKIDTEWILSDESYKYGSSSSDVMHQFSVENTTINAVKRGRPRLNSAQKIKKKLKSNFKLSSINNPLISDSVGLMKDEQDFIFPPTLPELENNDESSHLTLQVWLKIQMDNCAITNNLILLDPDPTIDPAFILPVTPLNPISCKLCSKKLESDPEVKVHVTHCWLENKSRHRFCVPCNKLFQKINIFRQHTLAIHGTEEEKLQRPRYKCENPKCPKEFLSMNAMKKHCESHMEKTERARPFICQVCSFRFLRREYLNDHMRIHSDERPFKCPFPGCPLAFKMKGGLRYHVKTHSDSRPFQCPHPGCDKAFRDQKTVREHLTAHSEERPHVCEVVGCGKTFAWKKSLERHAMVHTNDKPFTCSRDGCSAAFKLKTGLGRHLRLHIEHENGDKSRNNIIDKSNRCNSNNNDYSNVSINVFDGNDDDNNNDTHSF